MYASHHDPKSCWNVLRNHKTNTGTNITHTVLVIFLWFLSVKTSAWPPSTGPTPITDGDRETPPVLRQYTSYPSSAITSIGALRSPAYSSPFPTWNMKSSIGYSQRQSIITSTFPSLTLYLATIRGTAIAVAGIICLGASQTCQWNLAGIWFTVCGRIVGRRST